MKEEISGELLENMRLLLGGLATGALAALFAVLLALAAVVLGPLDPASELQDEEENRIDE